VITRRHLLGSAAGASLAAASPARAQSAVLRMGDQRGNVRALMEAAGVLDGLPYRLEWSEFAAAAPLAEAMAAGAVDGGNIGDAPFTFAYAGGVPIRAIAANRANPQGTAILVPAGSPVGHFADLRGKRIATGKGSIGHSLVLAALQQQGWTPTDVQLVFLLPSDAKAALTSGAVDAWSTWEPYTSQIEVMEGGRQVVSGAGITPGLGFQAATTTAIAGKRDVLSDFVRRLAAARRWEQANLDRYAATWAKLMNFPEAVPQHWFARAGDRIVEIDEGVFHDLQRVIDLYAEAGLLRRRVQAADAFDPSFNAAIRDGNAATGGERRG
jgi:sulfonate transport system substrate-binding protein